MERWTAFGWALVLYVGILSVITDASSKHLYTAEGNKRPSAPCDDEQLVNKFDNSTDDGPYNSTSTGLGDDGPRGNWRRQKQIRHKRQTAIVGVPCQENIDCQTTNGGAFCDSTKRCDCLPAYVNINGYCWAKRNPGDTCQYQEQCTSVSPNTYCDTSQVCRCSNGQTAIRTADGDGPFCLLPGECPTNGPNSKLRHPDSGSAVKCEGDALAPCQDPDQQSGPYTVMYNCVCQNPTQDVPDVPCGSTEDAYCCPSRASACIQSKDEGVFSGGGGSPQQRWWYNSASGNCEPLSYRGSAGNGNNFLSRPLCESYCKTICPRGAPLSMTQGCSVSTPCGDSDRYECNTELKTTVALCCPKATFICSAFAGMPTTGLQPARLPDIGDRSYNVKESNRWYYDSGTNTCIMFTYRGYGGVFNNFHTESECRLYCSSTVCTAGEPLKDSGGATARCGSGGSAVCPLKYDCTSTGYCCPSVNFVCSQPQSIGGCSSFVERWWFNPSTRSCEKFFYSGCHGNFNNFATYQKCTEFCTPSGAKPNCPQGEAAKESGGINYIICSGAGVTVTSCPSDYFCHYDGTRYGCCPTRTKTCSVDAQDQGTLCLTPVTRWYYNSQSRQCDTFTYNGCDGNSNNFATKIDCQDYCGVGGCPEGGEPFRESSSGTYRTCGTVGLDCPAGYTCSIVTLGTSSRFNYCCPTRASVCAMGQDQGQLCGASTLQRYYFNTITRSCEMFTYNGCGGNRNNFASVQQCLNYCNSAGCPAGQVALQDVSSQRVTICDVGMGSGCPSNYKCSFSSVLQQGVCCGSTAPSGACPAGLIAYMDSFTNTPLQCQPNVDNACPNGIFCQFSYALSNSFCCGTFGAQCPQGGDPYYDNIGSQPRQCTPGLANVCPQGYTCQATTIVVGTVTSATGYCCGQANVCGSGYTPYYVNNQAVPCLMNQVPSVCPAPFACRQNVNSQSYCCAVSGQVAAVCVPGKEPYLVQGSPTLCTLSSPSTGCPAGYTCDLYASTGSSYCCRLGGIIPPPTTGCPSPFVLLQPVTTCSPGVTGSCPVGYFCNWDQAGSRFVCCGSGTGPVGGYCPVNSQPYINPATGQPQVCMLGSINTGCPAVGYRCSYSTTQRNYYCCTGTAPVTGRCPAPLLAAINPSTGQPQTCVLGAATCPIGYQCTSTVGGVPLCCGRGSSGTDPFGCPFGTAYLYPGTRTPLACTRTGTPCPIGYSCQQSTTSSRLQCCSTVGRQGATNTVVRTNEVARPAPGPAPAPVVQPGVRTQTASGRKACKSNLDCRDSKGAVKLCVQGYCLQ